MKHPIRCEPLLPKLQHKVLWCVSWNSHNYERLHSPFSSKEKAIEFAKALISERPNKLNPRLSDIWVHWEHKGDVL